MSAVRATVIGAGIMGAAVGYHLARTGAAVQILEAAAPATATTGATFARLSAFDKSPREYFELNHAGMIEHARLAEQLGTAAWYHRSGSVLLAEEAGDDLAARAELFQQWGYALRWQDGDRTTRELGVRAELPDRVLHADDEGWVDAVALTRRLLTEAAGHGAALRTGARVTGLERGRTGWTVTVNGAERLGCDIVVNAAGEGSVAVAAPAGSALALVPSQGLLIPAATPDGTLRRTLHGSRVSIRPDGPGRVLLRSEPVDRVLAGHDAPPEPSLLRKLAGEVLAHATRLVPGLAPADPRIGRRVLPRGGYPRVGGSPELPGYYEAVAHSGVILAPLVGRLIAEEISTGRVPDLVGPYRPQAAAEQGGPDHRDA
ncbi:NAD(P)/FAD-dependent oxidoreductase [Actinoplanes teichomyceticus]|uniref:Glycine/D-amino acid oxidase-like deaminating enzyme n=1 Tax=Actinoplanes teichomyceticus TaxID=1867 RepID=A0A561VIA9_ACTTI|nr:FAD-dependent oxidoreductase [Actinoplanes teichomyceticus]TWG11358.1 glycine/D-amino acid oxidase-like deaminating enzyme [Actinoplanes teichomyceticus]GIF15827.1 D-amino-acid oxidase [Actinoplanes teichomyceticus]